MRHRPNMPSLADTLLHYETSCGLVMERIQDLSRRIKGYRQKDSLEMKELMVRRYLLYRELWDMQRSICEMKNYLSCMTTLKKTAKEL